MDLDECFALIAELSPNASKLAARMLRKDPSAPAEWAFALEVGLADRAHDSDALTTDDLLLIAMDKDPQHFSRAGADSLSPPQIQALEFVREVRREGRRRNGFILAPRRARNNKAPSTDMSSATA